MPKNVLVVLAHPNLDGSKSNKAIMDEISKLPNVKVSDLYKKYPDFKINVKEEQELLVWADLVVFQFPFYWYSTPALMKQWEDDVLTWGFAYGPDAKALHGKGFLVSTTTGGKFEYYQAGHRNNYTYSELLRPLQQTAILCGMKYMPAFVVDGMINAPGHEHGEAEKAKLGAHIARLKEYLDSA